MNAKMSALFVTALSFLAASPSYALVRELAACTTPDGKYTINVTDNEGIGPKRTPSLVATVTEVESGDLVAEYPVEEKRGPSISFGRWSYQEKSDEIEKHFGLSGPSTNFHNFPFGAEMNRNDKTGTLQYDDVKCTIFRGESLDQE